MKIHKTRSIEENRYDLLKNHNKKNRTLTKNRQLRFIFL
jgi:hypothetical protein